MPNVPLVPLTAAVLLMSGPLTAEAQEKEKEKSLAGADEKTPSKSHYFTWINHDDEGATEAQTLANLAFFKMLQDEYGMTLDIYAFDEGTIDGRNRYENLKMAEARFPNGFGKIAEAAKASGMRLGMWLGPDGFGDTPEQEKERTDMVVKFCKDYNFALFKFDKVCGLLRPEKQQAFRNLLIEARKYSPDLIALNHRLKVGVAEPHTTTTLWEATETYIDVNMTNQTTGTHNRVGALSRGLTPKLTRMIEDHGTCLSSFLDYWDDDLILQAFNRNLLLAPSVYGNPWFLRDDEYPKFARIFNLHKRYGEILVDGFELPGKYGKSAMSRGSDSTRFLTFRNLTWEPVKYKVKLNEEMGIKSSGPVFVRELHPVEKDFGVFSKDSEVEIEVLPFRSCLLMVTANQMEEVGLSGCSYEVVKDLPNKPVVLRLMGGPGSREKISLLAAGRKFSSARLDGQPLPGLAQGEEVEVGFPGNPLQQPWHRKLGELKEIAVPADARALYEATCYSSSNNALEYQCMDRSGATAIPEVQSARDMFFQKKHLKDRAAYDQFMFDGDPSTLFGVRKGASALRIDFGSLLLMDRLELQMEGGPSPESWAEVSPDLESWIKADFVTSGNKTTLTIQAGKAVRYVKLRGEWKIRDVWGFKGEEKLDRTGWRGSNRFSDYVEIPATHAWEGKFRLEEAGPNSYLCVALEGKHGVEGAYAALRFDGKPMGAPSRAPSMRFCAWQAGGDHRNTGNYTYFIPVTPEMLNKPFEVVVLTLAGGENSYQPSVWITSESPYVSRELVLER